MTPVQIARTYTVDIDSFAHGGEGVGRVDGFTVFVPGALPGETVQVRVDEVRKSFARATVQTVEVESPQRTVPPCPVYQECGGCQLQHLSYAGQLEAKRKMVTDAFSRIGGLPDVKILPVLGSENPWHYRNKAQFPVGWNERILVAGCYAKGSHQIVSTTDCLIQREENNEVLRQVCRIASALKIPAYDERTGTGVLRHIMGRCAVATGEVMSVLVTSVEDFAGKQALVAQLVQSMPNLRSVVQNINSAKTNVVMGQKNITLWGESEITESLAGCRFRVSAPSFFQVNPEQTMKLYNEAVRLASAGPDDDVLDLYCGAGTISLFLAKHAKKVYGIELSKAAIEDAKHNAAANAMTNLHFSAGDVSTRLQQLAAEGIRPSIAVLDPPRTGCESEVLHMLAQLKLRRIVYVSCNPSTLARDVALLTSLGYDMGVVQPVDMFPQTYHVECVAVIEKK